MVHNLENLPLPELPSLVVAVGVFDGVHRGHQALLAAVGEVAEGTGATPAALTFDPHPSAVFAPARTPELLGTLDERTELLHRYGADEVIIARFDRAFAALTPEEFVRDVLATRLRTACVVVGEDFRFGCNRSGDVAALRHLGEQYGFTVRIVPPVFIEGAPARSTVVRQLLAGGKVVEAANVLGRPYRLSGEVVHGRKLGRTLGFPTANIEPAPGILIPAAGIYAADAILQTGETFRAAVSIGTNPTVTTDASAPRTVEAHLLHGFDRNLYGQRLSLDFLAFHRPTLKFDSLDALVAQIRADVDWAAGVRRSTHPG